ncbi:MAG: hypothetical protein EXR62_02025 [Chloroflexi bacterium]|nr:hypothetical protein [Chloroflexota bacterium]
MDQVKDPDNNTSQPEITMQSEKVEVGAIEQGLNKLWMHFPETMHLAETKDAALIDPVMRACVLNLLIYAEGKDEIHLAQHLIEDIAGHTPCRIIFMQGDRPTHEQTLSAEVTAHCAVSPESSKQMCCEQITLQAHGEVAVSQLPATVLGLLVPDIPVTLWWVGNPTFGQNLFDDLAYAAGRTILDSAYFDPSRTTLHKLWQAVSYRHTFTAFCDLTWSRLLPWRELLAQFFDPPALRPYLQRIERVEIMYEGGETAEQEVNPNQALLLASWLAARAGWSTVTGLREIHENTVRYVLAKPNGWVILLLATRKRPRDRKQQETHGTMSHHQTPGNIAEVHLYATASRDGNLPQASFHITQEKDDDCTTTRVEKEGASPISRVVRMESMLLGELLGAELQRLGRDMIFEESLNVAAHLMEQ